MLCQIRVTEFAFRFIQIIATQGHAHSAEQMTSTLIVMIFSSQPSVNETFYHISKWIIKNIN
jgi:hypothetical protein